MSAAVRLADVPGAGVGRPRSRPRQAPNAAAVAQLLHDAARCDARAASLATSGDGRESTARRIRRLRLRAVRLRSEARLRM